MSNVDVAYAKSMRRWIVKLDGTQLEITYRTKEAAIFQAVSIAHSLTATMGPTLFSTRQQNGALDGSVTLEVLPAPLPPPEPLPPPTPEPPPPEPTPVPPPPSGWVSRVVLLPDNPTVKAGDTLQLSATYYDASGSPTTFVPAEWEFDPRDSSRNGGAFFTVDRNGLLTAHAATDPTLTFKAYASYLPRTQAGEAAYDNIIVTVLQADGTSAPAPTPVPAPTPTPTPIPTPTPGAVDEVLGPVGWPTGAIWGAVLSKIMARLPAHLAAAQVNGGTMPSYDSNYYDLAWLLYLLGEITGDAQWTAEGDKIARWYIDDYLAPNDGVQPHVFQGRGVEIYFRRTGYLPAKQSITKNAERNWLSCYTDAELRAMLGITDPDWSHWDYYIGNGQHPNIENRWCERTLAILLAAHRTCGVDYSVHIAEGMRKARSHLSSIDGSARYSQTSVWMDGGFDGVAADIAHTFRGTQTEQNCRAYAAANIPFIKSVYDPVNKCWPYDLNAGLGTADYGVILNALVLQGVTCWTVQDTALIEEAMAASLNENVVNWTPGKGFVQMMRALAVGARVATGIVA